MSFVELKDPLSGGTIGVPEDQAKLFEQHGFVRAAKPVRKSTAGGKGDKSTGAAG
jgi:hypothetical protein